MQLSSGLLQSLLWLCALALTLLTSPAQNVYSSNIVGFVSLTIQPGYSLLANPLSTGQTNGANEIMSPLDGEQILTWNGSGFEYRSYDTDFGGWVDINFSPADPPYLPPGKGFFFYNPQGAVTVTFVGNVIPAPCTTNTLILPPGYSLLGSPLPADANPIDASPVSLPRIDGMQVLQWKLNHYDYISYDSGFGGWVGMDFVPLLPPSYHIGEGFFLYQPSAVAVWSQSLDCP